MLFSSHADFVRGGYLLESIQCRNYQMSSELPCPKVCRVSSTCSTLITCQSVDSLFSPARAPGAHVHCHILQHYKRKGTPV